MSDAHRVIKEKFECYPRLRAVYNLAKNATAVGRSGESCHAVISQGAERHLESHNDCIARATA